MTKRQKRPPKAAALPPIPTGTPAGIRAAAIRDTLRAIGINKLHPQDEDIMEWARALHVPALFLIIALRDGTDDCYETERHAQDFVAWRMQLAGKAVA